MNQFVDPHQGLLLLNTESEDSCQEIPYPPFIDVISEVTDNENFSTFILAGIDEGVLEEEKKKLFGKEIDIVEKK